MVTFKTFMEAGNLLKTGNAALSSIESKPFNVQSVVDEILTWPAGTITVESGENPNNIITLYVRHAEKYFVWDVRYKRVSGEHHRTDGQLLIGLA